MFITEQLRLEAGAEEVGVLEGLEEGMSSDWLTSQKITRILIHTVTP